MAKLSGRAVALAAGLVLALAGSAGAQSAPTLPLVVYGTVAAGSGTPLAGVTVQALLAGQAVSGATATTASDGTFGGPGLSNSNDLIVQGTNADLGQPVTFDVNGQTASISGYTCTPSESTSVLSYQSTTCDVQLTAAESAPEVASLSPTSGPTSGGTTVTITGSGFTGATGVVFGSTPATSFQVTSDTQITATDPAEAAGTVDVQVTSAFGTSSKVASDQFTYTNGPSVSSVSPASGPVGGGTTVTIEGSGFGGATAVSFGATAATSFNVVSDTEIAANAPAEAAGTADVVVTTPYGTSAKSAADDFSYVAAPAVASVTPSSGSTTGGTTVTIVGSGFSGATAVSFGETAAPTFTVVSDTEISATAPAEAAGEVDVTVTTPYGTSAKSSADAFSYVAAPTVTSINPTSGPTTGGTSVTITGSGFTGATAVAFGSTPAVSFQVSSADSITAVSPVEIAGTVDVTVTTPYGTSAKVSADQFTYSGSSGGSGGGSGGGAGGSSGGSGSSGSLPPTATQQFGGAGGTLSTSDNSVTLSVPDGALSNSTTVSISEASASSGNSPISQTIQAASPVVDLSFGGATLLHPVRVTFTYTMPSGASALSSQRVGLFYDDTWHWVKGSVDTQSGTVTADVAQPGQYVVLVNTTKFNDIPSNYSASSQLDTLLGRGAVSGFPDGGFHPTAQVTRAQFVKMLVLALGLNVPAQPTNDGFKDVPADSWYAPYVDAAVQAKLVEGVTAAKFAPGDPITREQLAVMVARAMNGYTPSSPLPFQFEDEGRIGAWALPAVTQAVQAGIVQGMPDGTFAPLSVATRTDAVTWLGNLVTITNQ